MKRLDALWQTKAFIALMALTPDAVEHNPGCDSICIIKKTASLLRPFVWEDEDGLEGGS